MALFSQPSAKYLHGEWLTSNHMQFANADTERIAAERLIAETQRALVDTNITMLETRDRSTKRLDQRTRDVDYWKKEGEEVLDRIKALTAALTDTISRLGKAEYAQSDYLHITRQCLLARSKRQGVDHVHDQCEKELLKEVEIFQGVAALLRRSTEQATEQLRQNRKAQYSMEKDLTNKVIALGIDGYCKELNVRSRVNQLAEDVISISPSSSTVDQWLAFSQKTILEAEKARQQSAALLSITDEILQSTAQDAQRQVVCTNEAFRVRIAETRLAKETLEDEIREVRRLIREMEENIFHIRESIEEKILSLKLAQTRLENRGRRPEVELARDSAQFSLIDEVVTLEQLVGALRERLHHSECSLRSLDRRRLGLEEEKEIKSKSLFIDEVECVGMRKSLSVQCF